MSLFRPNFRGKGHFQRDETRDAGESGGWEWYQIVPLAKGYNSSYITRWRAVELTSGGQFTEKKAWKYAPLWSKFFQNFFWSQVHWTLYYHHDVFSNRVSLIGHPHLYANLDGRESHKLIPSINQDSKTVQLNSFYWNDSPLLIPKTKFSGKISIW